jgi:hypothetical protein
LKDIIQNKERKSMKIIRIATGQMIPTNPQGTSVENMKIQIGNFNKALGMLNSLNDIITVANDIHAKTAELGKQLNQQGLADQVLKTIQAAIMENPDFKELVTISQVGSVQELFNTGTINQKITFITKQLNAVNSSLAELSKSPQTTTQ